MHARGFCLLGLLGALCSAPLAAAGQPQFTVSYWYGPPSKYNTVERYREIKDANFTLAMPGGFGAMSVADNLKLLDHCQAVGLKAIIADQRMVLLIDGKAQNKAKLDAIVADYHEHPALFGYFVTDEPSAAAFKGLGEVVAYLKQRDPDHRAYINLFPTHAQAAQLGTDSYADYLSRFVKEVKPFVISYDHYAMSNAGDEPTFARNLAEVRNESLRAEIPFWNIVLCVQHYDYRHLSEAELRYEAMQTLAFGAHGLLWYTYWYPGEPNATIAHAMINYDGSRNPHYEMIRKINADARAIGHELVSARSWATFHSGEAVEFPPPRGCPISAKGPAQLTIGVFDARDHQKLALVANRDYRAAAAAKLSIEHPRRAIEQFDPGRANWSPAANASDNTVNLNLPAGGATLLRWATSGE